MKDELGQEIDEILKEMEKNPELNKGIKDENDMLEAVMKVSEEDAPRVQKGMGAMLKNIQAGMMPKDAAGITDEDVEAIYDQAYQLYGMGKYDDARKVFTSLTVLNPTDHRYLFAHAACSQMLGEYHAAADGYTHHAMMSHDDPLSYYHAADCYLKINDRLSALVSLKLVVKRAGARPEYKLIKERAEMTMATLEKELAAQAKSEGG